MPFPKVFGFPDETPDAVLCRIRADIITKLAEAANISHSTIRPFFPADRLGDPNPGQDNTIYCALDSGMFVESAVKERKKVTSAITEVIWRAFLGQIEVEVYIDDLNSAGKTLRKPALKTFTFEGVTQEVAYVRTDDQIAPGVIGDEYSFVGDDSKDLAIIMIEPGCKTPLQRVLKGTRTIEGYVSGKGTLTVIRLNGKPETYHVSDNQARSLADVNVGDLMQWEADQDSMLVFSEVCFPPYDDDRYKNIE